MQRNTLLGVCGLFAVSPLAAQFPPGQQGSTNVHVMSHVPLGRIFTVGNIDVEQELSRPYVYIGRTEGKVSESGFTIVSIKDPGRAKVLWNWRIENLELHRTGGGGGCLSGKYLKVHGRYYYAQGCQFPRTGPDHEVGAIVFDVTGLPDTSAIREVGRIRTPDAPGGFHEAYTYKHSDGRALLFVTGGRPYVIMYDMGRFVSGDAAGAPAGKIPVPEGPGQGATRTYHDMYVGYDPASHTDRFYGAGTGGYYVWDITRLEEPKLLTSVTGMAGMERGHTFTPTPDGRYAVLESEYQYAPLRIVDLKPGLDGEVKTISRPIGAYTPRWKGEPHNHEVRWPYVFVSGYEDGLYVFNMMDPTNPYTVGYYDTYEGPDGRGKVQGDAERAMEDRSFVPDPPSAGVNGAFGIDVRNADGLIVISDEASGFWALKMDGFDGWNGHQWGLPNVSSAQDWDNGPEGVPRPAKVS